MANCYVEESQFRSPHFENGVRGLGDLWTCRNSQSVGHNLFRTDRFCAEYLRSQPIKNCDYKLTHVKNQLETTKTLKVDGHLSLDLLLKTITLEGNISYRNSETEKENVEVINCTYVNESYQIDLMPPVDAIVNSHILQKICDKEIEATHVVGGVIVGAVVNALIEIKQKDSNSDCQVSGRGAASCRAWLGELTTDLKANEERKEISAHFDISVTCKARPMPDNLPAPSSIKTFFEFIEKLPSAMSKEKHFPTFGHDDITGVPVQFILYPLSNFVKHETELLYKQLDDDLLTDFQETISNALNIQQQDYFKKLISEESANVKLFLDNEIPDFVKKVRVTENQLRQEGQRFIQHFRRTLKEYKYGRREAENLEKLARDFSNFVDKSIIEILELV